MKIVISKGLGWEGLELQRWYRGRTAGGGGGKSVEKDARRRRAGTSGANEEGFGLKVAQRRYASCTFTPSACFSFPRGPGTWHG